MKVLYLSVMIALMLVSTSAFAYCPNYPTAEEEFVQSELVFVGKVVTENKVHETTEGYFDGIDYNLTVVEPLRGNPKAEVSIFSENSSGRFPMLVGESYLVFTSLTPDTFAGVPVYTISYCGNSGEVAKKMKALSLVRKLKGAQPNLDIQK